MFKYKLESFLVNEVNFVRFRTVMEKNLKGKVRELTDSGRFKCFHCFMIPFRFGGGTIKR